MSDYLFGVEHGVLTQAEQQRRDRAARKHGATFIYAHPPDGTRSWFACPGRGEPFDSATARAVLADVGREGGDA